MVDRGSELCFFRGIDVSIDIGVEISISIKFDHQIWQAGTYRVHSNETNQAGAGNVITPRSREKLKT